MKLTKEECIFLYMIHTTPSAELERLFAQAGLSEEELEALRNIMEE